MGKDEWNKEEKQKEKEEYYQKILGELGTSLITGDAAEQKRVLSQEAERLSRPAAEESSNAAVSGDRRKLLDEVCILLKEEKPDVNTVLGKFD
jgi:hypothetical protein